MKKKQSVTFMCVSMPCLAVILPLLLMPSMAQSVTPYFARLDHKLGALQAKAVESKFTYQHPLQSKVEITSLHTTSGGLALLVNQNVAPNSTADQRYDATQAHIQSVEAYNTATYNAAIHRADETTQWTQQEEFNAVNEMGPLGEDGIGGGPTQPPNLGDTFHSNDGQVCGSSCTTAIAPNVQSGGSSGT